MKNICSFCEIGVLTSVIYAGAVKAGRRSVEVSGLQKMVCAHCEEESIPLDIYGQNAKLVEAALAATPAAVSRGLLKTLRETFEVSQRDASKMFGAGDTAFAKWESGQTNMSDPAALLVQCALHVPGVMDYLAKLAKIEIACHANLRTSLPSAEYNRVLKEADVAEAKPQPLRGRMHLSKVAPTRRTVWSNDYTPAGDLRLAA